MKVSGVALASAFLAALVLTMPTLRARAAERGDLVREVSFIEVRSDASERAAQILRAHARALSGEIAAGHVWVLEEIGRPERFALLESGERARMLSTASQPADPILTTLSTVLVAPIDRRANRDSPVVPLEVRAAPSEPGAVYAVAHVDIAPPVRSDIEQAFAEFARAARASAGNLRFEAWQQTNRPNHFNLIGVWRARADLDAFAASDAARSFRASIAPLLGSLYDERVYRALE